MMFASTVKRLRSQRFWLVLIIFFVTITYSLHSNIMTQQFVRCLINGATCQRIVIE